MTSVKADSQDAIKYLRGSEFPLFFCFPKNNTDTGEEWTMADNKFGTERLDHMVLVSQEGDEVKVETRLVKQIQALDEEQRRSGTIKFGFMTSRQMRRVIEYLEFKDHYITRKNTEKTDFDVDKDEALDLLIIADKLGI